MPDAITVKIDGLAQVQKNLREIPAQFSRRILRDALHAAGEVLREAAEIAAAGHRVTGALEMDIVAKVVVDRDGLGGYVLVGPGFDSDSLHVRVRGSHAGEADPRSSPGVYGLFVEIGHSAPGMAKTKRRKKNSGVVVEFGGRDTPAHPWLRPAYEASAQRALAAFVVVTQAGLLSVARAYETGMVRST